MPEQAVVKQTESGAPPQHHPGDHDEQNNKQQSEDRSQSLAQGDAQHVAEEETWAPSLTKTETTLEGTFGTYKIKHGFHYIEGKGYSYLCDLTMTANDKAKADKIGWIQVVRRTKGSGGSGWATGKTDQGMTEERAKRTDQKTGFRVDRASATEKKTPFYGMDKGDDGSLTAGSNTKVGKHGGENPWLWDRPGLYDKDELEFVSTATDMATGTQYDGVRWGCKFDKDGKVATEVTPSIIKAGNELAAGRDRAINTWNTDVANDTIDKVPTAFDSAGTAKSLSTYLKSGGTDVASVKKTLQGVTDGDQKKQLQASYKLEVGRELSKDLSDNLSKDDQKGLEAWL